MLYSQEEARSLLVMRKAWASNGRLPLAGSSLLQFLRTCEPHGRACVHSKVRPMWKRPRHRGQTVQETLPPCVHCKTTPLAKRTRAQPRCGGRQAATRSLRLLPKTVPRRDTFKHSTKARRQPCSSPTTVSLPVKETRLRQGPGGSTKRPEQHQDPSGNLTGELGS